MHTDPEVRLYHHFLKEGEAEYIIKLGTPFLARSRVEDEKQLNQAIHQQRSSYGALLPSSDEVVANIKTRICSALNVTLDQLEELKILRYIKGQQYAAHYDWFSDKVLLVQKDQRQR